MKNSYSSVATSFAKQLTQQLATHWAKLVLCCLFTAPLSVSGVCLNTDRLTGVNLAGAEFNSSKLPGIPSKDYTYPKDSELTFIAEQGANVIRLPFRWERIQPKPLDPLASEELQRLQQTVKSASDKGLCVILDVHNYAKYYGTPLQDNSALQTAFVDLWLRLAVAFPDPNVAAFGLMNEPNYITIAQWGILSKRTLAALRKATAKNLIFVGGGNWSGLHDWFTDHDGMSNATAFADLSDPLNRTILEVHQYADEDYSGTGTTCHLPDKFNTKFGKLGVWATEHRQRLFLGEFGVPPSPECLLVLERFLSLMNGPAWKGWSYWAAGGWWGDYPMALNTDAASPSLQWQYLKKYFGQTANDQNPPMPPKPNRLVKPVALNQEKLTNGGGYAQ